eukprot:scaffold13531_cov119-Isochrysis_galbana.AAC.1
MPGIATPVLVIPRSSSLEASSLLFVALSLLFDLPTRPIVLATASRVPIQHRQKQVAAISSRNPVMAAAARATVGAAPVNALRRINDCVHRARPVAVSGREGGAGRHADKSGIWTHRVARSQEASCPHQAEQQ